MARTCAIAFSSENSASLDGRRVIGGWVVRSAIAISSASATSWKRRGNVNMRRLARSTPPLVKIVEAHLDLLQRVGGFVLDDVPLGSADAFEGFEKRFPVDFA